MSPQSGNHQPLEILESGTGHGSLTLHLARAIQAANNMPPPPLPRKSQVQYLQGRPTRPDEQEKEGQINGGKQKQGQGDVNDDGEEQWNVWRSQRKAIIHTVDISSKFSIHAEKIVRGFRRGIYAGNVDFYVGHVENWIAEQTRLRTTSSSQPFLSYVILDMPSAHLRIPHIVPLLRHGGMLVVFMPSITQIGDCVALIRHQRLPFVLDRVVELGSGISSGRLWDVRFAVKKSRADPSSWAPIQSVTPTPGSASDSLLSEEESSAAEKVSIKDLNSSEQRDSGEFPSIPDSAPKDEESVLVCRPKVGTRIVGGGFVGLWKRIEDGAPASQKS